jgi:hypothetical protein
MGGDNDDDNGYFTLPQNEQYVVAADGASQLRRLGSARRINSSPASSPSKKRPMLIEEHYRVDASRGVVLPGVPKHEADGARDAHDLFNLVVIVSQISYRCTILLYSYQVLTKPF